MSTRATILVKERDDKQYIYHHHDGYPEGVGAELKAFLKEIKYDWDIEYIVNRLIKGKLSNGHTDNEFEWTSYQHGDEDYAYLIDCDNRTLKCYKVGWDEFEWNESKIVEIP